MSDVARIWPQLANLPQKISEQLETDAKYDVYLSRQADAEPFAATESFALADDLDYALLPGLSNEAKQNCRRIVRARWGRRPSRWHDAGGLTLIVAHVRARPRQGREECVNQKTPEADDRERAEAHTRFTCAARLDHYAVLLPSGSAGSTWSAPSTLSQLWTRHIADSLQLLDRARRENLVDLGSGAGLPGTPARLRLGRAPGAEVHLVESNGKKAAFLREAARIHGCAAEIHAERIENLG